MDNYGFRFREWNVYAEAREFRRETNVLLRAFPKEERFALVDQGKRALNSIVLNIAESANKATDKEMKVFLNRARCSLDEAVACLDCALDDGYINEIQHHNALESAERLAKRLNAFQKSVANSQSPIANSQKGFTLPELLVAMFLFSVITGIAADFTLSAIGAQRRTVAQERLVGELTFPAEYVSRHVRQAKKDLASSCLTASPAGQNFEVRDGGSTLRFLDRNGACREFLLAGIALQERISPDSTEGGLGAAVALTSPRISVDTLLFQVQGAGQGDTLQPRVTLTLQASTREAKPEAQDTVSLQTTVSQRRFDRQE